LQTKIYTMLSVVFGPFFYCYVESELGVNQELPLVMCAE
jgi:hypothetical protein